MKTHFIIFEQTNRIMKKLTFLLATSVLIIACQPKTADVIIEDVEDNTEESFNMAEVNAGKVVYSNKCSKCHDAPVIKEVSNEKWAKVLTPMIKKAELTPEEEVQVRSFISYQQAQ